MVESDDPNVKYHYGRFGSNAKRVGQAVIDLSKSSQPMQTVGDTLDSMGADFAKQMEECIHDNQKKYKSPFYIFVLTSKEFWANNVMRNRFIARQTPPHAFDMIEQYANYTKTLYIVDSERGNVKVLWSIPSWEDCKVVAKNPTAYDPELGKWIESALLHKLDKDSYSFDWAIDF